MMAKPKHSEQEALQHMCAWAVQHIFNVNKEAKDIIDDKELTEEQRLERLKGPLGTDYRLLNYILLLRPARAHAEQFFPEQSKFFEWFDERCDFIESNNFVSGPCGCLGCKAHLPAKEEQAQEAPHDESTVLGDVVSGDESVEEKPELDSGSAAQ